MSWMHWVNQLYSPDTPLFPEDTEIRPQPTVDYQEPMHFQPNVWLDTSQVIDARGYNYDSRPWQRRLVQDYGFPTLQWIWDHPLPSLPFPRLPWSQ